MSRVTVLVAVYNAEPWLRECLDSLRRQTMEDLQIVCIDDGSTDSSLAILNDYARLDNRIRVIALKENHGLAFARNQGLAIADGQLIAFLDADDWLASDALQKAVDVFEQHPETDSVLLNLQRVHADGSTEGYNWHYDTRKVKPRADGSFEVMSGRDAFIASLSWQIHGVSVDRAWLYRKYPFDDSARFYSDDNTPHLHFLLSREVRCSDGIYYYRQVPSSISHHVGTGRMDWITAAESMKRQLTAMEADRETMAIWEWEKWKITVGCYWFLFCHRRELSKEERRYCLGKIKQSWASTDLSLLSGYPYRKLGWMPMKGHWRLFRAEETVYFSLRRLMKK